MRLLFTNRTAAKGTTSKRFIVAIKAKRKHSLAEYILIIFVGFSFRLKLFHRLLFQCLAREPIVARAREQISENFRHILLALTSTEIDGIECEIEGEEEPTRALAEQKASRQLTSEQVKCQTERSEHSKASAE